MCRRQPRAGHKRPVPPPAGKAATASRAGRSQVWRPGHAISEPAGEPVSRTPQRPMEDTMKALHRSRILLAAIPLVGIALAAVPAAAATGTHAVHISARLTVTHTAPPVCKAGICIIDNHGTGTMTPYGTVTFTTVITADGNQPPCGATSQWVNRIIRTITTSKGTLVLHEHACSVPSPASVPRSRPSGPPTVPTAPASSTAPAARAPTPTTPAKHRRPARNPHPLPLEGPRLPPRHEALSAPPRQQGRADQHVVRPGLCCGRGRHGEGIPRCPQREPALRMRVTPRMQTRSQP